MASDIQVNVQQTAHTVNVAGAVLAGSSAGVDSFNGRTGAVVPAAGDYTAAQITETDDAKILTSDERDAITANTAKVTNATHTGDVTGSVALTIAPKAVTNAKMADVATSTFKGRATAGTGAPEDLTAAQARAVLNVEDGAEVNNISDANATDLTEGGDSTLHYHAADRARANHTGDEPISALDIDGGTDIGADLADADLIIVDDGAGGTNRKSAISRLWTYIAAKLAAVTDISSYSWFLDQDDMSGNDATKVASQQSIKAYADGKIAKNATGSLGNLGATPSFTGIDGTVYTATYSANVTSWAGITVASGACICLAEIDNSGGYTVATTGLTAMESGALDDIASDGANLFIANLNGTLYARATINP